MPIVIEDRRGVPQGQVVRPSAGYSVKRVSWSALWAGAFTTLAIQLLCGLLGVWAAPNAPTLLAGAFPLAGIPAGVGVWYLIYTIAAYDIGGFVAARLGSLYGNNNGLHGFMSWAFTTMLGFFTLAILASRSSIGLVSPTGSVVTATNIPAAAMVSPGWLFGGLLLGLIAAVAGSQMSARPAI